MKIYTANRETGTFIDEFKSIEDAQNAIKQYEECDREEGVYEENFYDVVNDNHESIA